MKIDQESSSSETASSEQKAGLRRHGTSLTPIQEKVRERAAA
jgi:hypothetical protein